MNIGILGVGIIGSAIIEGLCFNGDKEHTLFISPRNAKRSEELSNQFENVIRCESNQAVIDQSDLVVISLLPAKGLEIISSLKFREDQHIINLMRNIKLDPIKDTIGQTLSLTHVVPLSFISKRQGPIAIYPKVPFAMDLLRNLGQVIAYDSMEKIESVAAITGLMTSYYNVLHEVANWGTRNDLTREEVVLYTTSFFAALTQHAQVSDLEVLSTEVTVGGINEYALEHLKENDVFTEIINTLDPMLKDVQKK